MKCIAYKGGYKYLLQEPYLIQTNIIPGVGIYTGYASLDTFGLLAIQKGYAWDGPSGPTIDTPDFMRGSLVHDVLYQLMREGHLDYCWREQADKLLQTICLEDGMPAIRAWWVYKAVRWFGGKGASKDIFHKLKYAPRSCG